MKNKKIYLVLFIIILYFCLVLQGPNIIFNEQDNNNNRNIMTYLTADLGDSPEYEWNRTWGGVSSDYSQDVAVDSLDNTYIVGYTYSYGEGDSDMILVKYDSSGVQQWNRTWGGINTDVGESVAVDSLDNVFIAGSTNSFGAGGSDMILVKYNSLGEQRWNITYGGINSDWCYAVAIDPADFIYITGQTNSFGDINGDIALVKYSNLGVFQWDYIWGGSLADRSYGLVIDSYYSVYVTGTSASFGLPTGILVRFNYLGTQLWNKTLRIIGCEIGYGLAVDLLDNIYVVGITPSGATGTHMILMKYNDVGVLQWNRTWFWSGDEWGAGVAVDSLGYVFCAVSTGYYTHMFLLKYDSFGVPQNTRWWGGGDDEECNGVVVDSLDNVYIAGFTSSFGAGGFDMALVKYASIPEVIVNTPVQDDIFGKTAPNFNISIIGANQDARWYTIDGGITNITFSGSLGTINQTEWDKIISTALVFIEFYANNTQGKEGYSRLWVLKDLDDPVIEINKPPSGFEGLPTSCPPFYLIIYETSLKSLWHTLDGGINNYTFSWSAIHAPYHIQGRINQTAWDAAPYGDVTIRFYAEDTAGNIGYNEVIIKKITGQEIIPGFYLLIFISMMGIITALHLKKKYKSHFF